jgi:hypothetical protein
MEILVAILIIALIAAVVYIVLQRRSAGPGAGARSGLPRSSDSPLPRRSRASARQDPMAAAIQEHADATDPHEVVAAEQRLRAQAQQVAAGMDGGGLSGAVPTDGNGHAGTGYGQVGSPRVDDELEHPPDPATPADYDSRNYDGRRAEDWQAYQDRRDAER